MADLIARAGDSSLLLPKPSLFIWLCRQGALVEPRSSIEKNQDHQFMRLLPGQKLHSQPDAFPSPEPVASTPDIVAN